MLLTIAALVAMFLEWCGRHRAPATVRGYGGRLQKLVQDLGPRDWSSIKPLEIDEWIHRHSHKSDGRPMAPDSIRLLVVAFERFQKWVLANKLEEQPLVSEALEKPRGRQRERVPTDDEMRRLLEHAPPAFQDIYQALRLSGARPNELVRARIEDLDAALGAIVLKEHKTAKKVGKPRVIPVGQKLAELIQRVTAGRDSGHIFLTQRGRPWTTGSLSQQHKELRDKAGLPKDLVLYMTRHLHGTLMTKKFGIHAAAVALGHASINTTQRYAHLTTDEQRTNQDALDL